MSRGHTERRDHTSGLRLRLPDVQLPRRGVQAHHYGGDPLSPTPQ